MLLFSLLFELLSGTAELLRSSLLLENSFEGIDLEFFGGGDGEIIGLPLA